GGGLVGEHWVPRRRRPRSALKPPPPRARGYGGGSWGNPGFPHVRDRVLAEAPTMTRPLLRRGLVGEPWVPPRQRPKACSSQLSRFCLSWAMNCAAYAPSTRRWS